MGFWSNLWKGEKKRKKYRFHKKSKKIAHYKRLEKKESVEVRRSKKIHDMNKEFYPTGGWMQGAYTRNQNKRRAKVSYYKKQEKKLSAKPKYIRKPTYAQVKKNNRMYIRKTSYYTTGKRTTSRRIA